MTTDQRWEHIRAKWGRVLKSLGMGVSMTPLPPPERLPPLPPPGPCERCKERESESGRWLCKKCRDDDDAAMMAAYMCIG